MKLMEQCPSVPGPHPGRFHGAQQGDRQGRHFRQTPAVPQFRSARLPSLFQGTGCRETHPEEERSILARILDEPLEYPIGEKVVYSDLGFMLLRGIVETVSGRRLDDIVREEIYLPLQLKDLFFVDPENPRPVDRFAVN